MPPKMSGAMAPASGLLPATGKKLRAAEAVVVAGSATGGEPEAKRHHTAKQKAKRYKKITAGKAANIVPTLVKAVAQTMSRTSELESVAYDAVLFTRSCPVLDKVKEMTSSWAAAVAAKGKGHGLGPPHLQAWEGLCVGLLADGLEIGMANRESLRGYREKMAEMSTEELGLAVRHCKAKPGYEMGHVKLVLSLRGDLERCGARCSRR